MALNDPDLTRVCDRDRLHDGRPSPDFRSPRHVIEVKELTSEPLRGFNGAFDKLDRHTPIPGFEHLWSVMVEVSGGAAVFIGAPEMPVLNTLIDRLTPMIKDLEKNELTNALHDHDSFERWARVIGFDGQCAVSEDPELAPGILLTGTINGQPHTFDVDHGVVTPIQTWLESATDQVDNAQESLAGHPEVHVLALMASPSGPASGLIYTLMQTPDEVPTTPLRLPDGIDVLVIATNTDVLRFAPVDGWSRYNAPLPRTE